MVRHRTSFGANKKTRRLAFEALEDRRMLAAVTLDAGATYQTIQGWGSAPLYPSQVSVAQAGAIMKDAGFNIVRILAGPGEFTYTTGGNLTTPVPISANLADNVAKFGFNGGNSQADLVKWLLANGLDPSRNKIIGSLWSPPHWMKITTGTSISGSYDPTLPYGAYGGNTAGGRVNPTMWTDWARYVLSDVQWWQQQTGLPMYAFSFQNEPDVLANYTSAFFNRVAVNVNDPTQGSTTGQWQLYGDGLSALSTELASHPEITTKFFGPELEENGPAASNPWFLSQYDAIRQNLISRGLLGALGAYTTHQYQNAKDGDAAIWDAWYNGSAHAALILSNGSSNVLGWLGPTAGIAGDNKEIWQSETGGEDQTWTKDGAMAYGLKIYDALVYGHVSGYTTWDLTGYNSTDTAGLVQLSDVNNPTNSYKFDVFKQFSRWIRPGAQRIKAVFENGKASIGGANELDTYNGLNVSAFNQTQDKRLTMVFVNMQTSDQSTTITLPAGVSIPSFQVYQTSGTQKYVQLADLTPSSGQITLTIPASSFVTITGSYAGMSPPTVATAAAANPFPAGASAALSVLGAYSAGESNLTYTWATTGTPPAPVSFSANGANAAKNTTATFTKAGVYNFTVTITDQIGLTTTSSVSVRVSFGVFGYSADIGSPTLTGSLSYAPSTGVYTVTAAGSDIWGASDQFRYSYAGYNGDGQITARVTSITNTDNNAKAGAMFRDSAAANAAYAFVWVSPGKNVEFETRGANGASSSYSYTVAAGTSPLWVRLNRSGSQFSAFYSLNGTSWTQVGSTQTVTMATSALIGLAVTSHNANSLNTSVIDNVSVSGAPTVTNIAAASPSPVTGTTAALSVLGADDGGGSNLAYTWFTTAAPAGAAAPVFSANGANAAKNTTVTFATFGSYTLLVTIADAGGLSTTSSVSVSVSQTPTSIVISPDIATVAPSGQKQFSAAVYDQFGAAFSPPSLVWSNANAYLGSINAATGLYTASNLQGSDTVTATVGTLSISAPVLVTTLPQASVCYRLDDGSGTTAADSSGNGRSGTLAGSPTWTSGEIGGGLAFNGTSQYVSVPALNLTGAAVTMSGWVKRNGAQSDYTGIVFYRNGAGTASGISMRSTGALAYHWNDNSATWSWSSGLTVPDGVWTFVALVITPSNATMYMQPAGAALQSAVNAVANTPQAFSGVSYIGQDPVGNRFFNGSMDDVRIYNASLSASQVAQLYDSYFPPTVAAAAAANPAPVTSTTSTLSALGASILTESALKYTWSVSGAPPAPVTFSVNGANAAKSTVATFSKAGAYTLAVTIVDSFGQFTTSSVAVNVQQTLTSLAVSPATVNITGGGTQQFAATGLDQFGQPLASQPTMTWTLVAGAGSLTSGGLYTPPYASGSATVQASAGGFVKTASMSYTAQAQWKAPSSSSWTTSGNWADAATNAALAAPGVRVLTGDTVLFAANMGPIARLDGANPTLAGITFNSATTSYTIAPGSGGTLQMNGGASNASIQAAAGGHSITARLALLSNLTVNAAANSSLKISGVISGTGQSLTKTGAGTLTLSGANSFTGGTTVTGGSLVVERGASLGGSLVIGAGSVVTLAASDAHGNPLDSVAASDTTAALNTTTGSPQPTPPIAASAASLAAAATVTSIIASSAPPIPVTVRPDSLDSAGSAVMDNSNTWDAMGLMALQSQSATGRVSGLALSVSQGSDRPSSLAAAGVSPTPDATTFLERQPAQAPDTIGKLLARDSLATAFADPEVLEWATSTPAARPSAVDADISLLPDDLLAAIGQEWRN